MSERPTVPIAPPSAGLGLLGDYLIQRGLVSPAAIRMALQEQTISHERLGSILVRSGFLARKDLVQAILAIAPDRIHGEELYTPRVPVAALEATRTILVAEADGVLYLGTLGSEMSARIALAPYFPDHDLQFVPLRPEQLDNYLARLRGLQTDDSNLVERLIREALLENASDVHLIPKTGSYSVFYRTLGVLEPAREGTLDEYQTLVSRIKDLSRMDIAERRLPQDGGFQLEYSGRYIDLRVATIPAVDGEVVVIRLLDPDNVRPSLDGLGITRVKEWRRGVSHPDGLCLICGPTGCHGKGTPILMFDGGIKPVEDVRVGDELMGPDSRPRKVIRLYRGIGPLYDIVPNRGGESFVVNDEHVLSLVRTNDGTKFSGTVQNIAVKDYLQQTKTFKHTHKLYRAEVDWAEKELPVDPYLIGALLGDGCLTGKSVRICNPDFEIIEHLTCLAEAENLKLTGTDWNRAPVFGFTAALGRNPNGSYKSNGLVAKLRLLGLLPIDSASKFVPQGYKTGSRKQRLSLLAGLLDTDGFSDGGSGYGFVSKSQRLVADLAFVARSLGLLATRRPIQKSIQGTTFQGDYWALSISGPALDEAPLKLGRKHSNAWNGNRDAKRTGFDVRSLGVGPYYGFQVDEDNLYVLGDFTVTHNSGKTTTLNATVREMDRLGRAIFSAEDPVEYRQAYVRQVNVNPGIGLDFSRSLRAFMRADPDVIILGEIRDLDTAQMAVRAAETGHLVLATLHTDSVHGAFARLRDIGMHDYELKYLLRSVLVQRLVRVQCPKCHGAGCPSCHGKGYSSRMPVSECAYFGSEEEVGQMFAGHRSWPTMREDAAQAVLSGLTDEREVIRVFGPEILHTLAQVKGA
ncbi:ATPase, T2SS/T4P/T4SS family [Thiomonas sp.]